MPVSDWLSVVTRRLGLVLHPVPLSTVVAGRPCLWKRVHLTVLCIAAVITLTLTVGHRFYNEPKLNVGIIAPETIYAPATTVVEDSLATQVKREKARKTAKVFTLDPEVNQAIQNQVQQLLDEAQQLRSQSGPLPIVPLADLPLEVQSELRGMKSEVWNQLVSTINLGPSKNRTTVVPGASKAAVDALQRYRRIHGSSALLTLFRQLGAARRQYQSLVVSPEQGKLQHTKIPIAILDLSELEWQQTQTNLPTVVERMLAQGIMPELAPDVLQNATMLQLQGSVPQAAIAGCAELLMPVLRTNVIDDPVATQQQAEAKANQIQPEFLPVQKGDVIVRKGLTINQQAFAKLEHFNLSQRQLNVWGLAGLAAFTIASVQGILFYQRSRDRKLRFQDYWLLLLLTSSVPISALLGLTAPPLPLMGLLISSFYGAGLGSIAVTLLTGAMILGGSMPIKFLVSCAAGALVASLVANRLRSREELALLGGAVGLTQGVVYLLLHLMVYGGSSWTNVIGLACLHGLTGFAWCVLALGVSPYLEHFFDLITPIRLAELSNPNRPLLQRLATETPGTFQHTLFVATLAEAAARALGCNVELVRAGTLYHDIGKMHDPQAFIENQLGCENKHNLINDPWISADLIKKHVTLGILMARKHRLPKAIEVFIPEHQGTMSIAYFLHQARLRVQADPSMELNEADFRYDGPAPQSRETALVMLADSCEAALRSLKDAEQNIALSTVHKILKARWHDGQLNDSGLNKQDMPKIAEIFVRVWQDHHHQRIAYPKAVLRPKLAAAATSNADAT